MFYIVWYLNGIRYKRNFKKIFELKFYFYNFFYLGIKNDQTSSVQWQKIHTGQDEDMVSIIKIIL